jgi:hypothetical protein
VSSGHDRIWDPSAERAGCTHRTISDIATHYEVLGVAPDAPTQAIRASYRARARLHHPDRVMPDRGVGEVGHDAIGMVEINEAYRVLSDPGRRALYDRTLVAGSVGTVDEDVVPPEDDSEPARRAARSGRLLSPEGPARFPWKPMLVVAAVGSALVLVSAAFADPPGEEVPDGILRTDSCVTIEPNGDAREVACTGEDDVVVELLIPTDAGCPVGMEAHRDRLGLGVACIVP